MYVLYGTLRYRRCVPILCTIQTYRQYCTVLYTYQCDAVPLGTCSEDQKGAERGGGRNDAFLNLGIARRSRARRCGLTRRDPSFSSSLVRYGTAQRSTARYRRAFVLLSTAEGPAVPPALGRGRGRVHHPCRYEVNISDTSITKVLPSLRSWRCGEGREGGGGSWCGGFLLERGR